MDLATTLPHISADIADNSKVDDSFKQSDT